MQNMLMVALRGCQPEGPLRSMEKIAVQGMTLPLSGLAKTYISHFHTDPRYLGVENSPLLFV
jgi:hypothetical protein